MNDLESKIEILRDKMKKEYSKDPQNKEKILELSQKLDKLLVQYQKNQKITT